MLGDTTDTASATDATSVETAGQVEDTGASTPPQSDSTDPPQQERKGRSAEERINRLTGNYYRERAAREAAEARARELEARLQPPPQQTQAPQSSGEPQESQFPDFLSYLKAHARWEAKQEAKAVFEESQTASREAERQQKAQESYQRQAQAFGAAMQKLAADIPDYAESVDVLPLQGPLTQALMASDKGAAVAYLLGNDDAERERLMAISDPVRAAMEVARLETRALQYVQSRGRSRVSPQGQPLAAAGATPSSSEPSPTDSTAEHIRKYRAELAAQRRRR